MVDSHSSSTGQAVKQLEITSEIFKSTFEADTGLLQSFACSHGLNMMQQL